jgi:hypothetical protein
MLHQPHTPATNAAAKQITIQIITTPPPPLNPEKKATQRLVSSIDELAVHDPI